jgi:hypothetical protein
MRQVGGFLRVLHNPNPNPLTICTVSFEEVECLNLIHDVVSPHCVYKNGATLHQIFSAELLCHDVISLECRGKYINVSNAFKATV